MTCQAADRCPAPVLPQPPTSRRPTPVRRIPSSFYCSSQSPKLLVPVFEECLRCGRNIGRVRRILPQLGLMSALVQDNSFCARLTHRLFAARLMHFFDISTLTRLTFSF